MQLTRTTLKGSITCRSCASGSLGGAVWGVGCLKLVRSFSDGEIEAWGWWWGGCCGTAHVGARPAAGAGIKPCFVSATLAVPGVSASRVSF